MQKTEFKISKMDCPSEENLIRMKLNEIVGIKKLDFDIPNRYLTVYHNDQLDKINNAIESLNLGGQKVSTEEIENIDIEENMNQRRVLWYVLIINFLFFIIELSSGILSRSMGLVADSLDMLADSFVYALSLIAVGGTLIKKKRVASLAGYFQITLALLGFIEVVRRFTGTEKFPDFNTMILVSVFALIANGICLYLLQKSKSKHEAHMKASMIFTSNDVIINLGVILAGILVKLLNSNIPDLAVGTIVFLIVIQGARRILNLAK